MQVLRTRVLRFHTLIAQVLRTRALRFYTLIVQVLRTRVLRFHTLIVQVLRTRVLTWRIGAGHEYVFEHPAHCNRFCECTDQGIYDRKCPSTLTFNHVTKVCDENAPCVCEYAPLTIGRSQGGVRYVRPLSVEFIFIFMQLLQKYCQMIGQMTCGSAPDP